MIDLVFIAGGGHAAELLSYLDDLAAAGTPVNLLGVIDEGKPPGPWETSRILGGFDALAQLLASHAGPVHYLTAVGNNAVRRRLVQKAEAQTPRPTPWTLRHPTAQIGRAVTIGPGTMLAPNVVVTTRVRIGSHCILNARANVHHDCVVGDYVNINPGATVCGNVTLGEDVFFGAGATAIERVSVGAGSIIGAGAAVVRPIPAHVTAVGVPARVTKHHQAEG
jgi:sugar O-acyltransferase (sialic acid O-acetyltransferase NeuD family)